MDIPQRFGQLVLASSDLDAWVKASIAAAEPWLGTGDMPLFPEYTQHGIDHVERVLRTAEELISEAAWPCVTAPDAAVLVVAALVHDCAMQLPEEGFVALVSGRYPPLPYLEDRAWTDLWEAFLGQASRFDSRVLTQLFGDPTPTRRPPESPLDWSKRDRMLIGEFLRRHHHRLAHEVAVQGLPTLGGTTPVIADAAPHMLDLAGLVARSHGIAVRDTLGYLDRRYSTRQFAGVHAPFLMAVLRVSDYVEISPKRAPGLMTVIRPLYSRISIREWAMNDSVRDLRMPDDDPEAIFLDAMPSNLEVFLRLKDWLEGLQGEIDTCWAVLGELYGRYEPDLGLRGLSLRRVRSNLDDESRIADEVSFYPVASTLSSVNPDLLRLLVGPLYGEHPGYGVRELLQNAVDAVRERDQREGGGRDSQLGVEVTLFERAGRRWLRVMDDGIGMSAATVRDYFLRAGASLRASDAWRMTYESDGRSRVLRSGRFGVGVLAAFLLGDLVSVVTRAFDEPEDQGVRFSVTLTSDLVQLDRVKRDVGTTVEVRLNEWAFQLLSSQLTGKSTLTRIDSLNWYCFDWPRVSFAYGGFRRAIGWIVPEQQDQLPKGWRSAKSKGLAAVNWSFETSSPALVCNGFVIRDVALSPSVSAGSTGPSQLSGMIAEDFELDFPRLSVLDPDGLVPLDLKRTTLTQRPSLVDDVHSDVVRDLIGYVAAVAPDASLLGNAAGSWYIDAQYKGLKSRTSGKYGLLPMATAGNEITLADHWLLEQYGAERLFVTALSANTVLPVIPGSENDLCVAVKLDRYYGQIESWASHILKCVESGGTEEFCGFKIDGVRIFLPLAEARSMQVNSPRVPNSIRNGLIMSWASEGSSCAVLAYGKPLGSELDFDAIAAAKPRGKVICMAECLLRPSSAAAAPPSDVPMLVQHWFKTLGRSGIPIPTAARAEFMAKRPKSAGKYFAANQGTP